MVRKYICLLMLCMCLSSAYAGFYMDFAAAEQDQQTDLTCTNDSLLCSGDEIELALQKRDMLQLYKECRTKVSHYSVSVLFFTVASGVSGTEEKELCLKEFANKLSLLDACVKGTHPEMSLFAEDERLAYLFDMGGFDAILYFIQNYDRLHSSDDKSFIDQQNLGGVRQVFDLVHPDGVSGGISNFEGSREEKDVILAYMSYLKAKYDRSYRRKLCAGSSASDNSAIEQIKKNFQKKYPSSSYNAFLEKSLVSFNDPTRDDERAAKEYKRKIKTRIKERKIEDERKIKRVWLALEGMATVGYPLTLLNNFDDDFNMSALMGVGVKFTFWRFFFQYQYNFAPGGNNQDGLLTESTHAVAGGFSVGPLRKFSVELLAGWSFTDEYPANPYMPYPILDYESFYMALQGNVYFPIVERFDISAHFQAGFRYVKTYCADDRWTYTSSYSGRCDDVHMEDRARDNLQFNFSAGVGVRFWKPRY